MQMKEKKSLTILLLGRNHGCITTNPKQSVLQCNGNIPVHLQAKKFKVTPSAVKVVLTFSQGLHAQNDKQHYYTGRVKNLQSKGHIENVTTLY
jgi:hypothetical protein